MDKILAEIKPFWKILLIDFHENNFITLKTEKFVNALMKIGFWIQFLNATIFASLNLPIFINHASWERVLWQSSIAFTLFYCCIVYLTIFINRHEIGHTQKILSDINVKTESKWEKYGFKEKMRRFNNSLKMFRKYFYICFAITFLKTVYELIVDGKKSLMLEFPFDATRNEIFPFIFVWIWSTEILMCIFFDISYTMFSACINSLCIEFEILKNDLKEWGEQKGSAATLKELIIRHNQLYLIAKKFNKIYGMKLFSNFIVSSFIICFNAFQMIITTQPLIFVINVMICFGTLILNGLQCYYGQKLKDASEKVAEVVYDIGWEN
jgi:hypothetical protein